MILSVVMSVYNAEDFVRSAIESILNQTYTDFELIIINDGSTDRSLEIIKSYKDSRIVLIDQKNSGLAKSLNIGISFAKSDYIARMDADDIAHPQRFDKQLQYLVDNNDCVVIGSNANCVDINGKFLFKSNLPLTDYEIKKKLPETPFFHSSTIFIKRCFLEAGQYPEEIFQYFEDKILWNKISKFGKFHNLKDSLIQYRMVPNSISNLPHSKLKELCSVSNIIIENNYIITPAEVEKIKHIVTVPLKQKYANYYLRIGATYLNDQQKWLAFKNLLVSFYYQPFERNTCTRLIACFLPQLLYKKLQRRKRRTKINTNH